MTKNASGARSRIGCNGGDESARASRAPAALGPMTLVSTTTCRNTSSVNPGNTRSGIAMWSEPIGDPQ
ncbi:MAG TPA: hypothetical protein DIW80_05295 [Gordonia polyisoprenivorans]|nr:hypothetical protein [Gordonia polyisoprenivorans]